MEDLIKRGDAIKAMEQRYEDILRIFKRKVKVGEKAIALDMIGCIKMLPSADRPSGYIHINDVYRLIAGHSDYHGDSILSAFTCLTEGKEVQPIKPLDRPNGKWINFFAGKDDEWLRSDGIPMFLVCNKCHGIVMSSASARWDFCPNCGARMKGADDE